MATKDREKKKGKKRKKNDRKQEKCVEITQLITNITQQHKKPSKNYRHDRNNKNLGLKMETNKGCEAFYSTMAGACLLLGSKAALCFCVAATVTSSLIA